MDRTVTTTTTTTTTTKKPESSTITSGAASKDFGGQEYLKAAIVLIGMQFFTLSIWFQLKI